MAKKTVVFGVLLIILGAVGYFGTGSAHPTALIPAWFGLALCAGGVLAMSPSETRRKIFMHINVTIGALGCIGGLVAAVQGYGAARSAGVDPDMKAFASKMVMFVLCAIYVNLCVRSFIEARRLRQQQD